MKSILRLALFLHLFSNVYSQDYQVVSQIPNNPFYATQISNDNKYVYSGQLDGSIIITDIATGFVYDVLPGHRDAVLSLEVSEDNTKLLSSSGGLDMSVILWDLEEGKEMKRFFGPHMNGKILDVDFVSNDKILSAGSDGKMILWDIETAKAILSFDGGIENNSLDNVLYSTQNPLYTRLAHKGLIHTCFTLYDDNIAVSVAKYEIKFFDIKTGKLLHQYSKSKEITSVVPYHTKNTIAIGFDNGSLSLFDFNTLKEFKSENLSNTSLKFTFLDKSDEKFCVVDDNGNLRIYDVKNINKVSEMDGFTGTTVDVSKDFKYATHGSFMGNPLSIWDLEKKINLYNDHSSIRQINVAAISEDETYMVTSEKNFLKIHLWDLAHLRKSKTIYTDQRVSGLFMHPDNKHFLITDLLSTIKLYNINTGQKEKTYIGHTESINSLLFFNQGKNFISCSNDKTINIWDENKNNPVGKLIGHNEPVTAMALSKDEKYLFSGGKDKTIYVWDLQKRRYIKKMYGHAGEISSIAVSPNNEFMVSCSIDKRICMWDIKTFKLIKEWNFDVNVENVFFKDNSSSVYFYRTGSSALESIHLENDSKIDVKQILDLNSKISQLIKSPNRNGIITLHWDGSCRIINLDTKNWVGFLQGIDENKWAVFNKDGYWDGSYNCGDMFAIKSGKDLFDIRQIALVTNRPDLILKGLTRKNSMLSKSFYNQYFRRLRKAGYSDELDMTTIKLPKIQIVKEDYNNDFLSLTFVCTDTNQGLKSYTILANGTPVHNKIVKPISGKVVTVNEKIKLIPGRNKIEVFCTNLKGFESLSSSRIVHSKSNHEKNLYILSIGLSKYQNDSLNLDFADKDATDILHLFENSSNGKIAKVYSKLLLNDQVTKQNVLSCSEFFQNVRINDIVLIFYAGHGMFDFKTNSYYLFTHNTNVNQLDKTALNYSIIEYLLSSISSRNKILLLDACESGEQITGSTNENTLSLKAAGIGSRGFKVTKSADRQEFESNIESVFQKDRYIFSDIFIRTGTMVFSSSQANELSYESQQLENGFFTHAIIEGFKGRADFDQNGILEMPEWKRFVIEEVAKKSFGLQNPTVDRDNIDLNTEFVIF